MTKTQKVKKRKISREEQLEEERLNKRDRMIVCFGVGFALFFVLLLGGFMFALQHANSSTAVLESSVTIKPDYPRHLVDFSLVDQSGHAVTRMDLRGKIVVVNFVFTSCSTVCPYVNAQMEKIQKLTTGESDVRLLSLALDPVDDSVPVLEKYGRSFGQDVTRWSFLTGDESTMRWLVGKSFLSPDTTGAFAYMPGNFAHSQRIVLVAPDGHIVNYFDGLNQEAATAVVDQIHKLKISL